MYSIILHKNAVKFFRKADAALKPRISAAIENIGKHPTNDVHVKKLRGELQHLYRYRVGEIRILYEVDESAKVVRIVLIKTRGRAYN